MGIDAVVGIPIHKMGTRENATKVAKVPFKIVYNSTVLKEKETET